MSSPTSLELLRDAYRRASKDLESLRPAYMSKDGQRDEIERAWSLFHDRFIAAAIAYAEALALTDSTAPIDSSRT